jgi:iron(III) transport system permease protein
VWAHLLRFFPIAVAVMWPAVRGVPRELIDAAMLEGGRRAVWRAAIWPTVRPAFGFAVFAVTLLSLGEVVTAKLVQPPGRHGFTLQLFDAMHYGADATVAAMCLLQFTVTAVIAALFLYCARSG